MYSLSFTQQNYPTPYNPIKTIEQAPGIAIGKLPSQIDLTDKGYGSLFPFHVWIDKQANRNLPFVLSIELKDGSLPRKTSQVFYFTIFNKHEDSFKYLGTLPEKDPQKTAFLMTFFRASKGCKIAQSELADMYMKGVGVKRDLRKALRYYALAAEQGCLNAQTMVALYISKGICVKQDKEAAIEILKHLADHFKYPEAQYQLALRLEQGFGCEKNTHESVRYCMLAAEQDHTQSLFALVQYYTDKSYNNVNYEKASDLIKILVYLNFGKEFKKEFAAEWLLKLDPSAPEFFFDEVEDLWRQILTLDSSSLQSAKT